MRRGPTVARPWWRPAIVLVGALAIAACEGEDQTTTADDPAPDAADPGEDADAPDEQLDEGAVEAPEEFLEEQPAWAAPPVNEIGAPLAIEPTVVEGDDVAIAVGGVTVHSEGVNLHVAVRYDPDGDPPGEGTGGPMDPDAAWIEAGEDELPEDLLVVAVTMPDGTTLSSGDEFLDPVEPGDEPEGPSLTPHVGMGDQWSWDQELWLWPSPDEPDGAIEVAFDWPERGIEDATVDIEVEDLDDAAQRVAVAWPDGED
jgi:hypothetical protein